MFEKGAEEEDEMFARGENANEVVLRRVRDGQLYSVR